MVVAPTPAAESPFKTCCDGMTHAGESLFGQVKGLVQAGNARHMVVKHAGHTVMDLPLTIGVVGMLAAPQVAVLGALTALVTECSVSVERQAPPMDEQQDGESALE